MSYEDTFRSIKIKDKLGLKQGASIYRKIVPISPEEHHVENRIALVERFIRKPGLNADIQNAAEATRMVANPDFEILGTNASSDDVTLENDGGILFTTDGADGDGVKLLPHLDTNQSAWTTTKWTTDKKLRFSTRIKTGAAVTNSIIWAGFKLTNTDVVATDNDQAYFRYENGVNSGNFQCVDSNNGTDNAQDSGVTVEAATTYDLIIEVDANRIPYYYINDVLVATGDALKTGVNLIPYVAVEADGAAEAKTLAIRYIACSRDY